MPIHQRTDSKGKFYQYGNQKKYYYNTEIGMKRAMTRAKKQGQAIHISQQSLSLK
jgi:hypothetical protein